MYPIAGPPGDEVKKVGQAIADKLGMKEYDAEKMVGKHVSFIINLYLLYYLKIKNKK